MKLDDFLDLVSDSQDMRLIYEGFVLMGKKEAIGCMLSEDVYNGIVYAVEAKDEDLKVFVKEDAHAAD